LFFTVWRIYVQGMWESVWIQENEVTRERGSRVRRIAAAEGMGVSLVWRILQGQSLYPYHIQQVASPYSSQSCRGGVLPIASRKMRCKHTVANILFTDEAGFSRDGTGNFHVWVDDNPHSTVAS
jgi:hypothetical protein